MIDQHKDPNSPSEMDSEGNTRKRCDGASPCHRCSSDNAICVFGERKKAHDKVYPKGYVEMLEQQQEKLVNGLRDLYDRLERQERWPGSQLDRCPNGFPLTHDILERLGLLHLGPNDSDQPFEEDPEMLLKRMAIKQEEPYPTPETTHSDFSPSTGENVDMFSPSSFRSDYESRVFSDCFPKPMMTTPEEQSFCMDSSMSIDIPNQYRTWVPPVSSYPEAEVYNYSINNTQSYNGLGIRQEQDSLCLPTYGDDLGYTAFSEVLT